MANIEQVAKVLGVLSLITAKIELTQERILAYHRILEDLPGELLEAAALQIGSSNTFFPAAAELRQAAFGLMAKAEGLPSSWDAWAEVVKSFGTHGYYRGAPEWSSPLIGKAVEAIGGYAYLCHSDNPPADRARFVQAYESYLGREKEERAMLPAVRGVVAQIGDGMRVKRLGGGDYDSGCPEWEYYKAHNDLPEQLKSGGKDDCSNHCR